MSLLKDESASSKVDCNVCVRAVVLLIDESDKKEIDIALVKLFVETFVVLDWVVTFSAANVDSMPTLFAVLFVNFVFSFFALLATNVSYCCVNDEANVVSVAELKANALSASVCLTARCE